MQQIKSQATWAAREHGRRRLTFAAVGVAGVLTVVMLGSAGSASASTVTCPSNTSVSTSSTTCTGGVQPMGVRWQ